MAATISTHYGLTTIESSAGRGEVRNLFPMALGCNAFVSGVYVGHFTTADEAIAAVTAALEKQEVTAQS